MRPMLQRVLNSCLPDHASQGEVIMALTRQTNTQSPQDKANFEAIVKDKGQNLDVSTVELPLADSSHKQTKVCGPDNFSTKTLHF